MPTQVQDSAFVGSKARAALLLPYLLSHCVYTKTYNVSNHSIYCGLAWVIMSSDCDFEHPFYPIVRLPWLGMPGELFLTQYRFYL